MLHTKFRGNRPSGSGEDFWRVLTIHEHGGHLGLWPRYRAENFNATTQGGST